MKIGKKSYVLGTIILLISIFSVSLLNNSKPIKASDEIYKIETSSVNSDGFVEVKLSINTSDEAEFFINTSGIAPIDMDEFLKGVNADFDGKLSLKETDDLYENLIQVKTKSKPLDITFNVRQYQPNIESKITLSDSDNKELAARNIQFTNLIEESYSDSPSVSNSETVELDKMSEVASNRTATKSNVDGYVPSTPEEIEQSNAAANLRFQFLPETKVSTVKSWSDFIAAYNDNTVTKIVLGANITDTNANGTGGNPLNDRIKSLEIDGQKNTLHLNRGHNLSISSSPTSFTSGGRSRSFFHMHNINVQQGMTSGLANGNWSGVPEQEGSWSFVAGYGTSAARTQDWYFRFGDITNTNDAKNNIGVARLARAYRAEITMYGYNDVNTIAENYYTGSIVVEPGTYWKNTNNFYNYSTAWYQTPARVGDTGETKEFTVGKNSFVYARNTGSGTAYPAIYQNYGTMTIGENATFNANMQGNAVRFDNSGSEMIVKSGATINLLSRGGNAVVDFRATNTTFRSEPGAKIYIVGESNNSGIINLYQGNTTFSLDSPGAFDIRNRNITKTTASRVLDVSTDTSRVFEIKNSDIDLWKVATEVTDTSDFSYTLVDYLKTTGRSVSSSEPSLQSTFNYNGFRRISGLNTNPEILWTPVTDADKSYETKIIVGYTPSDSFDQDGNAVLQPVYAGADQVRVTYTDTYDVTHTVSTVKGGGAPFTDTVFNQANKEISAHAQRGPWSSDPDIATTVIDITPPEPAIVTGGKVNNGMKQLIGKDAEPKAKIYVDIDGVRQSNVGVVSEDGTWAYNLPRYLNVGETVQIFLEDNAGKVTEAITPAPPSTNNANGNINPATELKYRDAIFKAATKYTVGDVIPDNPLMEKAVISSGDKTTQVGDILTYTLTAKNGKNASLDAVWNNVTVKDVIPNGLTFDPSTAEVTINGTAAGDTDFTYDADSRLLTVNVGNLKAGAAAIVTFKTEVQQSAVGKVINNVGTATGFSPRESGEFIEGPDDSNRAHDVFSKDANVDNPGGSIFGILELVSAPKNINFGTTKFSPKGTKINNPSYEGGDLVVKDGRAVQETWTLNARLEKELAKVDDPSTYIPRAIRYVHQNDELTLMGASQPIVSRKNSNNDPYNISGTWSPEGDGFKLKVDSGQSVDAGKYEATIIWELVAGPPPVKP